jgi:hypothetical protein
MQNIREQYFASISSFFIKKYTFKGDKKLSSVVENFILVMSVLPLYAYISLFSMIYNIHVIFGSNIQL